MWFYFAAPPVDLFSPLFLSLAYCRSSDILRFLEKSMFCTACSFSSFPRAHILLGMRPISQIPRIRAMRCRTYRLMVTWFAFVSLFVFLPYLEGSCFFSFLSERFSPFLSSLVFCLFLVFGFMGFQCFRSRIAFLVIKKSAKPLVPLLTVCPLVFLRWVFFVWMGAFSTF